jgi:hypothetical protein
MMTQPCTILRLLVLTIALVMAPSSVAWADVRAFAKQLCFDCHDGATHQAGLDLETLDLSASEKKSALTWEKVFDRVSAGEMPPQESTQPTSAERQAFLAELGKELRAASLARQAREGRGPVRRLTRLEYEASVNDLLHIHTDLRSFFPEDAETAGFDKVGEGLTLSAAHLAAYQEAAEKALQMAIERGDAINSDEDGAALFSHMPDAFTSWGSWLEENVMVLSSRLYFPNRSVYGAPVARSGRYRVTVTAQARDNGGKPIPAAVGIHDIRAPKPGDAPDTSLWFDVDEDQPRTVTTELELDAGQQVHLFGPTLEPGLKLAKMKTNGERWTGRVLLLHRMKIEGPLKPDGTLDAWPGLSYRELFDDLEAQPRSKVTGVPAIKGRPEPWFPVSAVPKDDAARLLRRFMPKAFRRPVSDELAAEFVLPTQAALDAGVPFHRAMLDGYKAILCSPHFLLLKDPPGELDDFALASRLSYFLWDAGPDEILLAAAAKGELSTRAGRAAQIERMLNDVRSERFERSFVDQWLDLKNINATTPDGVLYAEIVPAMTVAAEQETRRFFHDLLAEDRTALECIQSDWTYANELLSNLYDLPPLQGYELRKVPLGPETRRGGLLTQASILKVTADGATTSPILRGKWINERILGIKPSTPPDDVPKIEPDIRGATTIREQLAKHRNTTACMGCHKVIDPPGFALETFDVIGGYREYYRLAKANGSFVTLTRFNNRRVHRGPKVESGYTMPDGRAFADVTEYKALLLEDKDRIVASLVANLLTYATGAPVQFADRDDIAAIVAEARNKNLGLRSLIHAVVQSRPFLHR